MWIVVSGGKKAGKTSVLCELENRGLSVVKNSISHLMERIDSCPSAEDKQALIDEALSVQLRVEREIPKARSVVFLERSVVDIQEISCGAGSTAFGADPLLSRYALSFILEHPNSLDDDDVRARTLRLFNFYKQSDITTIMVPPTSISERAEFILSEAINKAGTSNLFLPTGTWLKDHLATRDILWASTPNLR